MPRLLMGVLTFALMLPLLLVACGGADEPTVEPILWTDYKSRTPDGADLARNGTGNAVRLLQHHGKCKLDGQHELVERRAD